MPHSLIQRLSSSFMVRTSFYSAMMFSIAIVIRLLEEHVL